MKTVIFLTSQTVEPIQIAYLTQVNWTLKHTIVLGIGSAGFQVLCLSPVDIFYFCIFRGVSFFPRNHILKFELTTYVNAVLSCKMYLII